ncbi:hypothetical protein SAMN05518855_102529 [Paenibacillus sp. CF384]|nr:hypothetical protein SAMN05518855_102529 [Paenibacillus sp. CF384]
MRAKCEFSNQEANEEVYIRARRLNSHEDACDMHPKVLTVKKGCITPSENSDDEATLFHRV